MNAANTEYNFLETSERDGASSRNPPAGGIRVPENYALNEQWRKYKNKTFFTTPNKKIISFKQILSLFQN